MSERPMPLSHNAWPWPDHRVREGFRIEREALRARRGVITMARAKKKSVLEMIEFSRARDIAFNRIRLSGDNVRETDIEAGLDDLAHDIERREDLIRTEHLFGTRSNSLAQCDVDMSATESVGVPSPEYPTRNNDSGSPF